jgi:hypothetical protein
MMTVQQFRASFGEYGHLPDIKGSLVVAVRDAALEIAKSRQDLDSVLADLRKYNWKIFRRLEHFVLSKSSATEISDVISALQLKENFSSRRTDPEFYSLLTQWLSKAPVSVQETIFNIIGEGLDYSVYRARLEAQGESGPEIEKLLSRSKQSWQEEWMRELTAPLPPDLAKIWEETDSSQRANAAPIAIPAVRRGQPTPLSANDILAMTTEEFTNYSRRRPARFAPTPDSACTGPWRPKRRCDPFIGRGQGNGVGQALSVHGKMSLDAGNLFASIVALLFCAVGVLDALCINKDKASCGLAPQFLAVLANRFFLRSVPRRWSHADRVLSTWRNTNTWYTTWEIRREAYTTGNRS